MSTASAHNLMIEEAVAIAQERMDVVERPEATGWTLSGWLDAQPLGVILTNALRAPLKLDAGVEPEPALDLEFIRALGEQAVGSAVLLTILREGNALRALAEALWPAIEALAEQVPPDKASHLSKRFVEDNNALLGVHGRMRRPKSIVGAGLHALVGLPHPKPAEGIELEHTRWSDSDIFFASHTYGIRTSSRTEYWFVVDPVERGLKELSVTAYPAEARRALRGPAVARKPLPLSAFEKPLADVNRKLRVAGQPQLEEWELIAARLFTGPCHYKYNSILRIVQTGGDTAATQLAQLTRGNRYATTILSINSAIVKLEYLTRAGTVYRAIGGAAHKTLTVAPSAAAEQRTSFWDDDDDDDHGSGEADGAAAVYIKSKAPAARGYRSAGFTSATRELRDVLVFFQTLHDVAADPYSLDAEPAPTDQRGSPALMTDRRASNADDASFNSASFGSKRRGSMMRRPSVAESDADIAIAAATAASAGVFEEPENSFADGAIAACVVGSAPINGRGADLAWLSQVRAAPTPRRHHRTPAAHPGGP